MSAPWPPPPDLHSIRELVRGADPEGHLYEGAPPDEYDPEEEALFTAIAGWPTARLTEANLLPVIEEVWRDSFSHSDQELARSRPALQQLAAQIARFFGPDARPHVRNQPGSQPAHGKP